MGRNNSVFQSAVTGGHLPVVKYLVEHINCKDLTQDLALDLLHSATNAGHFVTPAGVRLSDELAYIATKSNMSNKTPKQMYPFGLDGNGMIRATRTPEDPAPVIRAHGLPLIAVARDTVALTGRRHALLGTVLLDKKDKSIKPARSAFTVGTIVAPKSFVEMPLTIDRQLFTHTGKYLETQKDEATLAETSFSKEFKPACNARNTMSSLHNTLAILMGDPITVIRLIDLPDYRLAYGPIEDSNTITEHFVTKFAIQPYSNMLALGYTNTDDVEAPVTVNQSVQTEDPTPKRKITRRNKLPECNRHEHATTQPAQTEHQIDPLLLSTWLIAMLTSSVHLRAMSPNKREVRWKKLARRIKTLRDWCDSEYEKQLKKGQLEVTNLWNKADGDADEIEQTKGQRGGASHWKLMSLPREDELFDSAGEVQWKPKYVRLTNDAAIIITQNGLWSLRCGTTGTSSPAAATAQGGWISTAAPQTASREDMC
ncbi:unnamed protein product [Penicillium viridicatum]